MHDEKINLLIVEDTPEQAKLMRTILTRSGVRFDIDHVSDAETGLAHLGRSTYDLVVMDYNLPKMNGLQAIREINEGGIRVPIIMVTGQGNERIAVNAMKLGASDYIVKDAEFLKALPRVILRVVEKNRLQQKLAATEQRYHELFEKASDAIVIVNPSDLAILEVNSMMEKLLGYSKSDLVRKTLLEICPPKLQNKLKAAIHSILTKGSLHFDSIQFANRQGYAIPVDINANQIDDAGKPVILMFIRDITERKKMQQYILLSRRRLISLFDGITDPISVIDRNYSLVMVNRRYSELAGKAPRYLIGTDCHKVLFHFDDAQDNCPIQETFMTAKSQYREIIQSRQTYHIWTFPMFGLDGRPEFVVEYAKDVTEQKKMEQQLIKNEKLASIGLLSSGIAHELRNPLNVIETARYSLEPLLPPDPAAQKNNEIIKKNIRRASRIIENLLQFSRNSDKNREPIIVPDLLDQTLSFFEKERTYRKVELIRKYNPVPKVLFNLDSLKQVLLNVIMNAIQAMPKGGTLTVTTDLSPDESALDIGVNDTGIGIQKEDLPHIFSPFFTTKRAGEGTGLGLYISYSILKREGGDVFVESVPGNRTKFTIRLPLGQQ